MPDESQPERRAARIIISPVLLHMLLRLPKDLHAVHVAYDARTDQVQLLVTSEHLSPVAVADELPIITPQYRGTYGLRGAESIIELTGIDGYSGPLDRESFVLLPAPDEGSAG